MYSLSPHMTPFQQLAGATPLLSFWVAIKGVYYCTEDLSVILITVAQRRVSKDEGQKLNLEPTMQ